MLILVSPNPTFTFAKAGLSFGVTNRSIDIVRWQNKLMTTARPNGEAYSPTYLRTINVTIRYAHLFPSVQEDMATALNESRGDDL